jgi:hypothetical protein
MASLKDLFNPTFLIFLGILVLVVALLVVYFESKMREQNHKIASMLSLVSTLADDMNGMKIGMNHLVIRGGQSFTQPINENLGINNLPQNNKLIEVSDNDTDLEDEEEEELDDNIESVKESDEEEDEKESVEEGSEDDENEDDEESDKENNDVKIIKIQVSNEMDNDEIECDEIECDETDNNDELPELDEAYVKQVLDIKYVDEKESKNNSNELRTISINLGDEKQNSEVSIDYKKLQLPKLRSIAVEKGLVNNAEANKLKKNEILKLLGVE